MPHFGLMDADALGPEAAALQRARLHMRAGKRRLRQGKISPGIGTLYDALLFAMEWYIASPERRKKLTIKENDNLKDDRTVFKILVVSGVVDAGLNYESFKKVVESALRREIPAYDYTEILNDVESVMTRLGVMPFDESELPPEDPATY
jgi:hypothetical protein